jgi:hypothetical protein
MVGCLREVGMGPPLLVAVEDDAEHAPLLERVLRNRYSVDCEVTCLRTREEALRALNERGRRTVRWCWYSPSRGLWLQGGTGCCRTPRAAPLGDVGRAVAVERPGLGQAGGCSGCTAKDTWTTGSPSRGRREMSTSTKESAPSSRHAGRRACLGSLVA